MSAYIHGSVWIVKAELCYIRGEAACDRGTEKAGRERRFWYIYWFLLQEDCASPAKWVPVGASGCQELCSSAHCKPYTCRPTFFIRWAVIRPESTCNFGFWLTFFTLNIFWYSIIRLGIWFFYKWRFKRNKIKANFNTKRSVGSMVGHGAKLHTRVRYTVVHPLRRNVVRQFCLCEHCGVL